MSLINQSSSKDRDDETERTSGKFGTGFLTTHLLSEIVNISGILETEPENYSRFRISLDRTGHDKKEIIAALEKAVSQLQECQSMLVSDYINMHIIPYLSTNLMRMGLSGSARD